MYKEEFNVYDWRPMTVRNDSKQHVEMCFFISCWAGLENGYRWAGVHIQVWMGNGGSQMDGYKRTVPRPLSTWKAVVGYRKDGRWGMKCLRLQPCIYTWVLSFSVFLFTNFENSFTCARKTAQNKECNTVHLRELELQLLSTIIITQI